jgi:GMP synthase (glutamine-hydrolysing)
MKKIGILVAGPVNEALIEKHGDYDRIFKRMLGPDRFDFETFRVLDLDFPQSVQQCDGWLITGSKFGVYERHSFIPLLEQFVRDASAARMPMVGICFGHQIMAQALGGKVVKFDRGWGLGIQSYELRLAAGTKQANVIAVHQDQVVERPDSARLIGSNDWCVNAALAYGDDEGDWAISFQPHPEFDKQWTRDLIDALEGQSFDPSLAEKGRQSLHSELSASPLTDLVIDFLDGKIRRA